MQRGACGHERSAVRRPQRLRSWWRPVLLEQVRLLLQLWLLLQMRLLKRLERHARLMERRGLLRRAGAICSPLHQHRRRRHAAVLLRQGLRGLRRQQHLRRARLLRRRRHRCLPLRVPPPQLPQRILLLRAVLPKSRVRAPCRLGLRVLQMLHARRRVSTRARRRHRSPGWLGVRTSRA